MAKNGKNVAHFSKWLMMEKLWGICKMACYEKYGAFRKNWKNVAHLWKWLTMIKMWRACKNGLGC